MKRFISLFAAVLIAISPVSALGANGAFVPSGLEYAFKPSENYEEAEKRLLNGEAVLIVDLIKPLDDADLQLSENVASFRHYDSLTDFQKAIYDFLNENSSDMMNSWENKTFSFSYTFPCTTGLTAQDAYAEIKSNYIGNSFSQVLSSLTQFDNPEFYWIDIEKLKISMFSDSYSSNDGYIKIKFKLSSDNSIGPFLDSYSSTSEIAADYEAMEAKIAEIIEGIPENASDFETILYFNDWLAENASYNPYVAKGESTSASELAWTPVSALVYGAGSDTTKYPVCEGYAESFKILCDRVGIDCQAIVSSSHKWNIVALDGKNYYIDCTFNHPSNVTSSNYYRYNYLLLDSASLTALDSSSAHTPMESYNNGVINYFYVDVEADEAYADKMGISSYRSLDANGDYRIRKDDAAARLTDLLDGNVSIYKDCNGDKNYDILDSIFTLKLICK